MLPDLSPWMMLSFGSDMSEEKINTFIFCENQIWRITGQDFIISE